MEKLTTESLSMDWLAVLRDCANTVTEIITKNPEINTRFIMWITNEILRNASFKYTYICREFARWLQ